MELLEKEVKKTLESSTNSQYFLYYGISPDNIHFAILATKGLWYKLRVFGNLEGRQIDISKDSKLANISNFTLENLANLLGFPEISEEQKVSMGYTEHTTEEGVKERIEQWKTEIENGLYNSIFPPRLTHKFEKHFYFKTTKLRKEAIADPDIHLQMVDIIGDNNSPQKYAIYIGNGEIVYNSSKNASDKPVISIGNLSPDFVHAGGFIDKLIFPYFLREPEKIVEIAKSFVNPESQKDEYKLLYESPQTFVTRSTLGLELPLGQAFLQTLLQKFHM